MTSPDTTCGDNQPKLPNRYVLVKGLGEGGMSQVYLATDTTLLKNVAIKVLHSSGQSDPQQLVRFQREAKITGQLKHRNIVGINDFGMTSSGQPYIVMDHIEGESLADILARIGRIELYDAIPLMLEILDAVEFAHTRGVLHRDLKPSNIIINHSEDEFDVVKLIDFGIAKFVDPDQSLTGSGSIFGSPAYMSPEQSRGKNIDARSEVYSLGCLFFSILTGQPPFEAETSFELLNLQCNEPPPLLRDVQPDTNYSEEIQSLISKCLEKDPDNRVQSVAELSSQLRLLDDAERQQRALEEAGEGATARSVFHLAERSDKRTRKSAMQRTNLVLTGLVAVVVIAWAIAINVHYIISQAQKNVAPIQPDVDEEVNNIKNEVDAHGMFKLINEAADEKALTSFIPQTLDDEDFKSSAKEIANLKYTKLKLRSEPINGSGLKYIHNPNLQHLDLANVDLSKEGWEEVSKLKTLKYIDLEGVKMGNNQVHYLLPLTNLQGMNLSTSPELDRVGYATLAKIPSLQIVTIVSPSKVPDGAIAELMKSKTISGLGFTYCRLTPEDLIPIRSKTNNFRLTFDNVDLNQKPLLNAISELTLGRLHINCSHITPESLMALKKSKADNISFMECTGITKTDLEAFKKLCSPRKVSFQLVPDKSGKVEEKK